MVGGKTKFKGLKYSGLIAIGVIHLIPLYILVTVAFKPVADTTSKWIMPGYIFLNNFSKAWESAGLGSALCNTIVVTAITMAILIIVAAAAAYPLARYKTNFNKFIYSVIVSCMVVPALSILVPLYSIIVEIGGMNTYWAIILVHVTFQLPLAIFLYTGFINTISKELDEAALIDGCNRFGIFYSIILPLLKPITASIIIITGVNVWNDYQFSIFFLQKGSMQTIPAALSRFISQYQNDLNLVAAGCLIGMLPMVLVYLSLQKYFIKGLAEGGVKG
ncbi:MAG: carbohydrate ABC transporter permease [Cellulosilyticaceae bacterium]